MRMQRRLMAWLESHSLMGWPGPPNAEVLAVPIGFLLLVVLSIVLWWIVTAR